MDIIEKPVSLPQEARDHLERYWSLARQFFEEGNYPLASFFAITLIEEVGKVIILGNKDISSELDQKGFYDHRRKYTYAVAMTLRVNSRVSRVYGEDESRFAKWFREGELLKLRNSSLYLEYEEDSVQVPSECVSRNDSFLLVCMSGEVYGEIQGYYIGTDPAEWERIIKEVDEFRERNLNDKQST